VRLYARAAAQGRAAPLPFFVAGYLAVWSAMALPGYLGWRALETPLAEGRTWVGVLAGVILIAAALWQLTPMKASCLRHCRSPIGFFLRFGGRVSRPTGALRMGIARAFLPRVLLGAVRRAGRRRDDELVVDGGPGGLRSLGEEWPAG
jgi:predicted metal-binding membrane protein